eukprot:CAMPEP_0168723680 /NCGR_PEP_ID=MMETSP0724-20121128/3241_1 /TAXON_ID=265536 /ORGANISM="Amphiprora sp., Strain CCMP467" /LENGTH=88 /DNA_ID=CAMNT_0008770397 /DNA_START=154 /DNA_END=417 /DNA_ORIENTATION=+
MMTSEPPLLGQSTKQWSLHLFDHCSLEVSVMRDLGLAVPMDRRPDENYLEYRRGCRRFMKEVPSPLSSQLFCWIQKERLALGWWFGKA